MKKLGCLLLAVGIMAVMSACSKSADTQSYTAVAKGGMQQNRAAEAPQENQMDMALDVAEDGGAQMPTPIMGIQPQENRKIIWYVDLSLETLKFEELYNGINTTVTSMGGYVERSSHSGVGLGETGNRNNRSGTVVARIPHEKLEEFLTTVGDMGNVIYTNRYSEDVTLNYTDIETRKKTLEIEQQRLLELLEQAKDIETIIQVESRLSEVRYQLDNYTSSLKQYDSLIDYSTVTLNISEVATISSSDPSSLGERISAGFQATLYNIKTGAVDFVVWFVVNIPFIMVGAAVMVVVILVIRKKKGSIKGLFRHKKTKEQDDQDKPLE